MQRNGFYFVNKSNRKQIHMKKAINNSVGLAALAAGCFLLFSCTTTVIKGQTTKESRNVSAFSGVALAFSGNIYITQGNQQSVEIEADKKTLEIIRSEVNGNTLVLKTENGHWRDLGKITVYITMPEVDNLSISGSGDIICENAITTNEIDLNVSGSGSLKMEKLSVHEISAVITGSGDILLKGSSMDPGELDATITGSGSFKAEELPVGEATVTITGSGSATINVSKELETRITGSGSVLYKGNPMVNANATGSGRTRSLN
jgi:hypothetical protein